MRYFAIAVLALVLFVGCTKPAGPGVQDRKPTLVTEHDGIKVWKVKSYYSEAAGSGYQTVYFTTPSGDVHWRERQGKSDVDKQTLGVK